MPRASLESSQTENSLLFHSQRRLSIALPNSNQGKPDIPRRCPSHANSRQAPGRALVPRGLYTLLPPSFGQVYRRPWGSSIHSSKSEHGSSPSTYRLLGVSSAPGDGTFYPAADGEFCCQFIVGDYVAIVVGMLAQVAAGNWRIGIKGKQVNIRLPIQTRHVSNSLRVRWRRSSHFEDFVV